MIELVRDTSLDAETSSLFDLLVSESIQDGDGSTFVELVDAEELEKIDETREEPPARLELRRRGLGHHSELARLNVGGQESSDAVRRADTPDSNEVEEVLDTEHAVDVLQLSDDSLAPFFPLTEVLHPRDDA